MVRYIVLFLCLLCCANAAWAEVKKNPRTIIGVYQKKVEPSPKHSLLHAFAEMPLNHLGVVLESYDFDELPDLTGRDDVIGVIVWSLPGIRLDDPSSLIAWCNKAIDNGKKMLLMGHHGLLINSEEESTDIGLVNSLFNRLGVTLAERWTNSAYNVQILKKDEKYVEFERKYDTFFPSYLDIRKFANDVDSHLILQADGGEPSHVIFSGSKGGFVSSAYEAIINDDFGREVRRWYLNPFTFFPKVFGLDKNVPVPDVTTMAGRRIYYSHIDGDGWNSLTQLEEYATDPTLVSEIVMEYAVKPYPDLPVTVAPVAADLDLDWVATEKSLAVAREILALPQVELGTHTYSHPLEWSFFADGDAEKERPYLKRYRHKTWGDDVSQSVDYTERNAVQEMLLHENYEVPRAFASQKFDLDKEIFGAVKTIESFAPEGKKVKVLQWSGDCEPFEEAVVKTYAANLFNINGGDNRFDVEYDSYAWVAPIGKKLGDVYQIYASTSNENTYTDDWTDKFYGYNFLRATLDHTEAPIRLLPFNIYYHMYSAEKASSLKALTNNLDYARASSLNPMATSEFSEIALGFYGTEIEQKTDMNYVIHNRGALQTIRVDNDRRAVDFKKSTGVMGENYTNESLYVYLDKVVEKPEVVFKERDDSVQVPYLRDARWQVWQLVRDEKDFSFMTKGYGGIDMTWYVPYDGKYTVSSEGKLVGEYVAQEGKLTISNADFSRIEPAMIKVTWGE